MNPTTYISIGISLLVIGFNCAMFLTIKFNDLSHLTKDVKEIKEDVKTLVLNSQKLEVRMGEQEMKCKMQHKRSRRNKEQKQE